MADDEIKVEKIVHEETRVEWKISNFFPIYELLDIHRSPYFRIADAEYILVMKGLRNEAPKFASFHLMRDDSVEQECTFGLKNIDGNFVQLPPYKSLTQVSLRKNIISLIKINRRVSEFSHGGALIVQCSLQRKNIQSVTVEEAESSKLSQSVTVEKAESLELSRLDKLSENFRDLFGNKEACDTTLKLKDTEYKVHRSVLIARSTVFAAAFKHDTLESRTGVITIPDCDPESFRIFLEYLYCGKLGELSFPSALHLYETSDKYDLLELKEFCVQYLMHYLTVENMCEIVLFADKYDENELLSKAQAFFNKNVCEILETSEWESFMDRNHRLANRLLKGMSKVKLRVSSEV